MVVTRSHGDAAEQEDVQRQIELERRRRQRLEPPASPTLASPDPTPAPSGATPPRGEAPSSGVPRGASGPGGVPRTTGVLTPSDAFQPEGGLRPSGVPRAGGVPRTTGVPTPMDTSRPGGVFGTTGVLTPSDAFQPEGSLRPSGVPGPSGMQQTSGVLRTSSTQPVDHEYGERLSLNRSTAHSIRSTTSVTARLRLAELQAAEQLAELKKREMELEADLIKKRLAAQVASIHDEESVRGNSVHDEPVHRRVDKWLQQNPVEPRGERHARFDAPERSPSPKRRERTPSPRRRERTPSPRRRGRSPTPVRTSRGIEQLAEAIEKMARPRPRYACDLPSFSGEPSEWLPFKAAVVDSTKMYNLSAAENLQRLRVCLKGDAKEAVAALLHTACSPEQIMKTLEQNYGRPEVIIDRALDDLRKLPRPGTSAADLNAFAVKIQSIVCMLKNIDKRGYLYNPMLAREVLEKLSPHVRSRWCDFADMSYGDDPEIVLLSRFLMREADIALRYTYAPAASTSTTATRKEQKAAAPVKKTRPGAVYSVADGASEQRDLCSCGQIHALHQCPAYKALTVDQRWDMVKNKGLCFRCVNSKHRRIHCKAKLCGVNECRRPHHPSLHAEPSSRADPPPQADPRPRWSPPRSEATPPDHAATEPGSRGAVLSVAATNLKKTVLLKVCPVVITGPRGAVSTHALLDEGATITLIDEELAERIGADGPAQALHLHGVNMTQRQEHSKTVSMTLRGKNEHTQHSVRARTVRDLQLHQQSIPTALLDYEHFNNLDPDAVCYDLARPHILVGADHWELIVSRELRVGAPNAPAASRTQLGWVIHGSVPRTLVSDRDSILHVYAPEQGTTVEADQRLHQLVEAHFKIEALGVAHTPRVSSSDQRAMNIVQNTIKKTEDGYEVGLTWRSDDTRMPPSYEAALRRLRGIEKKMDANPVFAAEYTAQVDNLLKKEYAVPCDGTEEASPVCWYLPHFAVRNPNKPRKLRLVFDAAARSSGVSLNDHLLEGPDLLLSLPGILYRFREHSIAVTADIQEMFLRIKIRDQDQPAQQFLWRGQERTNLPKKFKMKSMIFGAASSPYMAHSVRNHNAHAHAATHPLALVAITRSHYMDDLVDSYQTKEEACQTIKELREVHASAGFTLRNWSASDNSVLEEVPDDLKATSPNQLGTQEQNKILGLVWDPHTDQWGFNTTMSRVPAEVRARTRAPTKREALSAVMSVFDPLGLLSIFTIRAKLILQNLWRLEITWDEPIPEEEGRQFTSWLEQLDHVTQLRLPRSYGLSGHKQLELHMFCDASEQAYAAVAYLRATYEDGSVRVALVAAKAKVAPKRTQTIPRLELQAAVIGARLANQIKNEHRVEFDREVYWTDSTTVIQWIENDNRRYTPYVAHRLGELSELTCRAQWRWLPTQENVADEATRYSDAAIEGDDRWFQGPEFLKLSEDQWPTRSLAMADKEDVLQTNSCSLQQEDWLPDCSRFSNFEKLVRTVSRVLAFVDLCRRRATELEVRHLEEAERRLMRRSQAQSFSLEIEKLKTGRPIPRSSRLYKLDPVLEDGLLRARGRIGAANVLSSVKRPIILDGRDHFTQLIVKKEHSAAGHANRERVANDLRQRYMILRLRPTIRAVGHSCAECRLKRTKPTVPPMGDLPRARLDPYQRPFTNCGVDYFGPMMVKIGRRREKRWGALFTCLTTRAVHLELASSLSTDSALMALRRMAARRGWPRIMYSDNGTNFKGADHELRNAYAEWLPALRDLGLTKRMEWRFIPPGAPNQGGAWERLVRSIKNALQATLREKAPPEEVLQTLLAEAEHAVNARPLTHVSVDPSDPEALTPNHFLLGSSTGLPYTGPCKEQDRRAWRASQALADHFWQRWLKEYLPTLVPRGAPSHEGRNLQVGDIVVVVDPTLPRNVWPRGAIERVFPGPDGTVRVADVRTSGGVFRRPVRKLVVLIKQEEATQAAPGGG